MKTSLFSQDEFRTNKFTWKKIYDKLALIINCNSDWMNELNKFEIYSFVFTKNHLLMIYISLCTNATLNNCKRTFKVFCIRKKGGDLWHSEAFFVRSHQRGTLYDVFVGHTHSSRWICKCVYVQCTRKTNKPRHKILEPLRNGNKALEMVIKHFYAHWTATIKTVGLCLVFFFLRNLFFSLCSLAGGMVVVFIFHTFGAFASFFFLFTALTRDCSHKFVWVVAQRIRCMLPVWTFLFLSLSALTLV